MSTDQMKVHGSLGEMFTELVPSYTGKSWRPFVQSFRWDSSVVDMMYDISERRCVKRLDTYIIPGEIDRSRGSIRFGNVKGGHGFKGKRGDFCLIGGAVRDAHLTLFYRRLELIGGLHFDTVIMQKVDEVMGPIRKITLMAMQADVFAPTGCSNEKLYKQLKKRYKETK